MKIATWNIERLRNTKLQKLIQREIENISPDILILTEYDNFLELPEYPNKYTTEKLPKEPYNYKSTERRVAIFSKFPIKYSYHTFNNETSCCVEIILKNENLIVYGTILGVIGIGDKNFHNDVDAQITDIYSFARKFENFCYAGDLNTTFSDNYYVSKKARIKLEDCFDENNLINATENLKENIDHIVLSEKFINNRKITLTEWNLEKEFSDHKGICVELHE